MMSSRRPLLGILTLVCYHHSATAQTLQWARQFASPPNAAFQIAADSSGVYIAGATRKALPGQTQVNIQQDGFLRKYDSLGTLLWTREFAANNRPTWVNGVTVDSTGVYVAGKTELGNRYDAVAGTLAVVNKFDTNGNLLWTHETTTSSTVPAESATAISANGGAVYVVGKTININPSDLLHTQYAYVRKLDSSGNEQWTKLFSANAGTGGTTPFGISADSSGEYIVGSTNASLTGQTVPASQTLFIRKYDPNGNAQWTDQFGATTSDHVYAVSAGASGVYAAGSTEGLLGIQTLPTFDFDAWVRKYDSSGHVQWTQQFGTIDREEAFGILADDTGASAVGYARSGLFGPTLGGSDVFVRRFDSNGNALWTIQTGSVINDYGFGVATDAGGIYIAGYSDNTNTIPQSLIQPVTYGNAADSFLYKYSPPARGGPVISTGGIVNNASFAPSPQPVAPGSITAIFGTGLNDGSQVLSSAFGADAKLVTTLGGASVTVGNVPAPMFYSTSGQLGIQIPFEMAGQTSAAVQVTVAGQTSLPATINLSAVKPGLFTVSQDGRGTALCLHSDGVTPVTSDNPAHPGEVVILYGTGLGSLTTPLGTGQPSSGNLTASTPTIMIDGLPAQVMFSGLAPGFVGLNQINVLVPGLARTNAADPVVLSVNAVPANAVTLPIGPPQ